MISRASSPSSTSFEFLTFSYILGSDSNVLSACLGISSAILDYLLSLLARLNWLYLSAASLLLFLLFLTRYFQVLTSLSPCLLTCSVLKIPSLTIELIPFPILDSVSILEVIGRFSRQITNFWNNLRSFSYILLSTLVASSFSVNFLLSLIWLHQLLSD